MNEWTTTYRVARSFEAGGRTFRGGEILRSDDPDVGLLLRVETLLGKQPLLVRTQLADRPALSSNARETAPAEAGCLAAST